VVLSFGQSGCFEGVIAYLAVLEVSLYIYHVFGFWCYLDFSRVDLAFFAYDYLATLVRVAS